MSDLEAPSKSLQRLLLRRFSMAAATYCLVAFLCTVAHLSDLVTASLPALLILLGCVLAGQLVFFWLFISERNQHFDDPSLTEAQVLFGITCQHALLAISAEERGTFLVFYALILLFGVFQLRSAVFWRCTLYALFGFIALNLYQAYNFTLGSVSQAILQVATLAVVLLWLGLFASYLQSMRQRMRQRRVALQAHQDTLRGMMRQLEDLVATDELTGLCNRRNFIRLATRELKFLRHGRQHGLALIDLDYFKRINDAHGHAAGDRVLQTFAGVAQSCLREGDIIARYGGEEFVLLLPNTDADQFTACCERLREAFSNAEPVGVKINNLSLSVGMTLLTAHDDLDDALHRADQALYQAKRDGRNRCSAAWEDADA